MKKKIETIKLEFDRKLLAEVMTILVDPECPHEVEMVAWIIASKLEAQGIYPKDLFGEKRSKRKARLKK